MKREKVYKLKCRECHCEATAARPGTRFCSQKCRTAYTNRRRDRGAEMYDLIMCWRYDRATAAENDVMKLLCRLAEKYNDQDKREGRQSWEPFKLLAAGDKFSGLYYEGRGAV